VRTMSADASIKASSPVGSATSEPETVSMQPSTSHVSTGSNTAAGAVVITPTKRATPGGGTNNAAKRAVNRTATAPTLPARRKNKRGDRVDAGTHQPTVAPAESTPGRPHRDTQTAPAGQNTIGERDLDSLDAQVRYVPPPTNTASDRRCADAQGSPVARKGRGRRRNDAQRPAAAPLTTDGESGRRVHATHSPSAASPPITRDRSSGDAHSVSVPQAAGLADQDSRDDQHRRVRQTVATIREAHIRRQAALRARIAQVNQLKAFARQMLGFAGNLSEDERKDIRERATLLVDNILDGKPTDGVPDRVVETVRLFATVASTAIIGYDDLAAEMQKVMEKAAKTLPVWTGWAEGVRGIGALGLAKIVGECGDIGSYRSPAAVWKRMGVGVINGVAQGKLPAGSAADLWIEHGYNRARRSIMYTVGEGFVKQGDEYRQIYLARKQYETERDPDIPKIRAHRRAQRYAEKRFLRDLWRAWRRTLGGAA